MALIKNEIPILEYDRSQDAGQLLFTADSLAAVEAYDTRNWAKGTFEVAMRLGMDAAVEL